MKGSPMSGTTFPLRVPRRSRLPVDARAARDILPVIGSLVPFGMLLGVAMGPLAIHPAGALVGTTLIYGGSAQLALATLVESGASNAAILAAVVIIQARLLVYGAALEPRFRDQPALFRWLAPIMIVDQTYALAAARDEELPTPAAFRRYWLTMCGLLTLGWLGAVGAGMALGPVIPVTSPLRIAIPALFVGILAPRLTSSPAVAAAATAAAVAALCAGLPNSAGLIIGIVAGAVAGSIVGLLRRDAS
jgi:predicted branched-subunit amino acid permease